MKRYFDIILALLLVVPVLADCGGGGGTASQDNRPWTLVWEDNFDQPTINTDDWAPAVQGLNWNNEDQVYIAENVTIEDGNLVLTAKHETWTGLSNRVDGPDRIVTQQYTSGELNTKRFWTYGKFEFRAKFSKSQGVLSAL
jgi:beta-glucanase (GH16 family)